MRHFLGNRGVRTEMISMWSVALAFWSCGDEKIEPPRWCSLDQVGDTRAGSTGSGLEPLLWIVRLNARPKDECWG